MVWQQYGQDIPNTGGNYTITKQLTKEETRKTTYFRIRAVNKGESDSIFKHGNYYYSKAYKPFNSINPEITNVVFIGGDNRITIQGGSKNDAQGNSDISYYEIEFLRPSIDFNWKEYGATFRSNSSGI